MSDSDSDYCDVGTEDFESIFDVAGIQDNIRNRKTNANRNWLPIKTFDKVEDYELVLQYRLKQNILKNILYSIG